MRYLKKIALVSDITYNMSKMQYLKNRKVIDRNTMHDIVNSAIGGDTSPTLYINHGAIYENKGIYYSYADNLEEINMNMYVCHYKYGFEYNINEIIKPDSKWVASDALIEAIHKYNSLSDDADKITAKKDIIALFYQRPVFDKRFEEQLQQYMGKNIYQVGTRYYIDVTNDNVIKLDSLKLSPTEYDFEKPEVDKRLRGMVWSHGLAAYGSSSWKKNLANIIEHPEMEISCSKRNQNLGYVGVYLVGDVVVASHTDIYSDKARKDYQRHWNPNTHIKRYPILTKDNISEKYSKFAEIIVKNIEITGIWVKRDSEIRTSYAKIKMTIPKYKADKKRILNMIEESTSMSINLHKPLIMEETYYNEDERELKKAHSYVKYYFDVENLKNQEFEFFNKYLTMYCDALYAIANNINDVSLSKKLYTKVIKIRNFRNIIASIWINFEELRWKKDVVDLIQEVERIAGMKGWPITYLENTISVY